MGLGLNANRVLSSGGFKLYRSVREGIGFILKGAGSGSFAFGGICIERKRERDWESGFKGSGSGSYLWRDSNIGEWGFVGRVRCLWRFFFN